MTNPLSAGLLVLDAAGGSLGVLAKIARYFAETTGGQTTTATDSQYAELLQRVRALELSTYPGRRIRGHTADVLGFVFHHQVTHLFETPEAEEVLAACALTPLQTRETFEELEALDLFTVNWVITGRIGASRARLSPAAYLRVAHALLPDVQVGVEAIRVLRAVASLTPTPDRWRAHAPELLAATGIPLPRFDLLAVALAAYDLVDAGGMGSLVHGRNFHFTLRPLGPRLLRGDDETPWSAG